jgi:hypothetical protein
MKTNTKFVPPSAAARQAETDKTNRLRALRLAKEAAEKEAAAREAAAKADKPPRKRTRAHTSASPEPT